MEIIMQIIGWVGTILIITAYFLVSKNKVDGNSNSYQIMNLVGAVCLGINVYYVQSWPALALQVMWGAIAITTLLKRK